MNTDNDYELVHITDIKGIQGNIQDFGKYNVYITYMKPEDTNFVHNSSSIITQKLKFKLYEGKNFEKERERYGIVLDKDHIIIKQIFANAIGSNGMLLQKLANGKYKCSSSTIEQDIYTDVQSFINKQKNISQLLPLNEVLSCAKSTTLANKCVKALLFNESDCSQLPEDIKEFKNIIKENKLTLMRYDINNDKNRYSKIPENEIDNYFIAIEKQTLSSFLDKLHQEELKKQQELKAQAEEQTFQDYIKKHRDQKVLDKSKEKDNKYFADSSYKIASKAQQNLEKRKEKKLLKYSSITYNTKKPIKYGSNIDKKGRQK